MLKYICNIFRIYVQCSTIYATFYKYLCNLYMCICNIYGFLWDIKILVLYFVRCSLYNYVQRCHFICAMFAASLVTRPRIADCGSSALVLHKIMSRPAELSAASYSRSVLRFVYGLGPRGIELDGHVPWHA